MKKFLNYDRILCLSPHPDDVEYSMGGTIMKYRDTHFDVICLSQGGDCDETTHAQRLEEVREFWRISGCENVTLYFTDIKHVKDMQEDLWVNLIEQKYVSKNNYDAIITTNSDDSHFEHKITNHLAAPLARIHKISVIEYCSPSTLEHWIPNTFVDIEEFFEKKVDALQAFNTQKARKYFTRKTIQDFSTNFRCSKRGLNYVEQFKFNQIFI
jgi:LmbE family N-acetylglucosaminyl deacetylase